MDPSERAAAEKRFTNQCSAAGGPEAGTGSFLKVRRCVAPSLGLFLFFRKEGFSAKEGNKTGGNDITSHSLLAFCRV
jgi:hypothetical protein